MSFDRREFLKLAGLGAAASLLGTGAYELLAPGALEAQETQPNSLALTARRWGMVIDMKAMSLETAQACVQACHSVHNVPDIPSHQNIKWIWLAGYLNAFPETENPYAPGEVEEGQFLTLCNHCENPPCVRACPTKATYQTADGLVLMDYHRCIGCRFCMAACPYGARSFNFMDPRPYIKKLNLEFPTREKGVVEKCNFCAERLAIGQGPACVEASGGAILYGDMSDPSSPPRKALSERFSIRRKPNLGTNPHCFYLV